MRATILTALAAASLLAIPTASTPALGAPPVREERGRSWLDVPLGGPQPAATGFVEIRQREGRQRFEVDVLSVDPDVALEVFIDDGAGTMVSAGNLPAGASERALVLDTGLGGTLPAGAATVEDLVGRSVEVRDAAPAVVLAGSVPALGFYDADGNGTDDTRGKQQVRPGRARAALMRATDTSDDDALGFTDAKRKPHEDVLWILVRNLAEGDAVEFFVEDEAGTMVSAGTGTADADGHAALHSSTADGGALPLNAWSVDDLAGQRVEVRAAGGATILYGIVPQATTRAVKYRARATIEDDDSPATAEVQMFIDPRAGRERLRIDVQGLGSDDQAMELWMDDGTGTSTFVLVESKDPPVGDQARFQWDTKSGQALPLQAETLKDLQGRAFEIRVNGTAALSGSLPSF